MFEYLFGLLQNNPQVAGALTLVIGGSISYIARDVPRRLWLILLTQTTCSVDMDNTGNWNGSNERMEKFMSWYVRHGLTWLTRRMRMTSDGQFEPGDGIHFFIWKKRLFWFSFTELPSEGVVFRKRILSITALSRSEELVKECISVLTNPDDKIKTHITVYKPYYQNYYGGETLWLGAATLPIVADYRPLTNLEVRNKIFELIERYNDGKEWFEKNHAPYKRTIFLSGPPGTGKSTLAVQIAMMTGRDIYVIEAKEKRFDQTTASVPPGSVILFEDIHSNWMFYSKEQREKLKSQDGYVADPSGTSLSQFLNVLSGAIPLQDQIVIMTTNYKEMLDPAIYRPGRVDLDLHVGYLTKADLIEWLDHTVKAPPVAVLQLRASTFPKNVTVGKVYQLYEKHRDNWSSFIEEILTIDEVESCEAV